METKLPKDLAIPLERKTILQRKNALAKVVNEAHNMVDQISERVKQMS